MSKRPSEALRLLEAYTQAHELGVPVIVLGVPARYIHTHNAVMDLADLQACVDLSVALVRRLDAKTVKSLTQVL